MYKATSHILQYVRAAILRKRFKCPDTESKTVKNLVHKRSPSEMGNVVTHFLSNNTRPKLVRHSA